MKIVLWVSFAVLALLWTGGAALLAQLAQWSAQGLAAGGAASAGAAAAAVAMPAWLSPWLDAAAWAAMQEAVAAALAGLSGALPVLGSVVAWLVPAVWVIWGFGLLALLGLALAGAWALRRFTGTAPRSPQAA